MNKKYKEQLNSILSLYILISAILCLIAVIYLKVNGLNSDITVGYNSDKGFYSTRGWTFTFISVNATVLYIGAIIYLIISFIRKFIIAVKQTIKGYKEDKNNTLNK